MVDRSPAYIEALDLIVLGVERVSQSAAKPLRDHDANKRAGGIATWRFPVNLMLLQAIFSGVSS